MTAVALGLASSLAWGFADFFGGLKSRTNPLLAVLVVTQSAGLVMMLVVAALRGEPPPPAGAWIAWGAAGGVLGVIGLRPFYRGRATGNMPMVAHISST